MRLRWVIVMTILAVTLVPQPAQAGGFTETDFLRLTQQVQEQGRRIQAQARRIHTLERVNGEQNAKLGWFKECTPGPLDVGLFLDEELGDRFNIISQAIGDPAVSWQPLAWPTGAQTFALQVHPSCIEGSFSGWPW